MGPATEIHVIASRKAAWQSASYVVRSTTRPREGPERERIATGLRPRNDMGFIRGPIQPGQVVIQPGRRGHCRKGRPYAAHFFMAMTRFSLY